MSKKRAHRPADHAQPAANPPTDSPPAGPPAPGQSSDLTITLDGRSLPYLLGGALIGLAMLAWAMGWLRLPETPAVDPSTSLWVVVLTGFLAGGLSCLAVQGGLLAATIAQREQSLLEREARLSDHAMPVVVFLVAKLIAYTLLGALLGYVGSFLSLSPMMRGFLQVAIGVFMVIVALQLLDVHPFFRRFALTPPKSVQRQIRK
jgi:small-conductance mechanosensitive channel